MLNEITLGKWEDWLPKVEAQSVRLALLDMPYGTTANEWDIIPDLTLLWPELKRVLLPNGTVICTANQPFTTMLINSNPNWFKIIWYWEKPKGANFARTAHEPLRVVEEIIVFSPAGNDMIYHPQKIKLTKPYSRNFKNNPTQNKSASAPLRNKKLEVIQYTDTTPRNLLYFSTDGDGRIHETQKPIKLFQYLISTYSNPGDTVLDCFSGSGTTAIAALNTNRNFICIEKYKPYWLASTKRLELAKMQGRFNFDLGEAI